MTDLRQAAQAVIDRWDSPLWKNGSTADAIADLRTALEQQQAKPVAWHYTNKAGVSVLHCEPSARLDADMEAARDCPDAHKVTPLYTAPPQRKPLTDEQADQIISGLQTCHHQSSKREFLKVWLRDWAAHGIKEGE